MQRTMYPVATDLTVNVARQQISNASFAGSGELGDGDRGAFNSIPVHTGNPYDSNDYIYRWRQYVHLYEISWEARKIIRLPVEDALRKPWMAEGIPEEMATVIQQKLDSLRFTNVLSRSLMLERLLGGCLTFMGLKGKDDDTSTQYNPKTGAGLCFLNAIPVSRINRINWDTDPLSEFYMRPKMYMINGEEVHVSRCLVWDGEPLFDPYDFALTNFRSNLAGFGPSKLATVWDDIVKAVGTRQAAFQMIKTNNSIIMAIKDLQDLNGTNPGKDHLSKLKEIANSLSVYRAAIIDGDKVDMSTQAASFGSVPELIITFIQILSAASDIPATRFLGQAPGGLNATGESDLENYYNMIDSYQHQRIEPALRRVYDTIGYNMFGNKWAQARKDLTFNFPPLWNETDKEVAEKHALTIDNIIKLMDNALLGEKKAIDELNQKGVLSVTLDEEDLDLLGDVDTMMGQEQGREDLQSQLTRMRNSIYVNNNSVALSLVKKAGGNPSTVKLDQFQKGMQVELEHTDVTKGDPVATAKIVLAHLAEKDDYYTQLEKVENSGVKYGVTKEDAKCDHCKQSIKHKTGGVWRGLDLCDDCVEEVEMSAHNNEVQNKDFKWRPEPPEGEIESFKLHGMSMAIENPKGSMRSGVDPDGTKWSSILPAHYGYVKKTEGADGDEVDIYLGPHEDSELVFVVDQKDADTGDFDEHKVIFGALSMTQAKELYLAGFSDGRAEERVGTITPIHVDQFKQWLDEGDTTKSYSKEI